MGEKSYLTKYLGTNEIVDQSKLDLFNKYKPNEKLDAKEFVKDLMNLMSIKNKTPRLKSGYP